MGNYILDVESSACAMISAVAHDRAAGAPEGEIEITPEMVEAGFKVLLESGITEFPLEADKLWVTEIFRSMCSVRRRS
jgi:hypothetical protein